MYSILAATNTAKAAIVLGQVFEASCGSDTYVGCKVLGMLHLEAWPKFVGGTRDSFASGCSTSLHGW